MVNYVIGHKNPDTDSVCAAIALADLLHKRGIKAQAAINGDLNPETRYVLDKFGLQTPPTLKDAQGKEIFLVDHSEHSQSLENIDKADIRGIVDHHKLGDITTKSPIEAWIWPVGSSCTVITEMYSYYGVPISQAIAGAMLSAILSDTVIFRSVTTTPKDKEVAKALAEIAGIDDFETHGKEMFRIKSQIDDRSASDIVMADFKDFDMNGSKVGIGQTELVDISLAHSKMPAIRKELDELAKARHTVLFMLTDIIKEGTKLIVVTKDEKPIKSAFGKEPIQGELWLKGVMSRKKQIIPPLEQAFSSL